MLNPKPHAAQRAIARVRSRLRERSALHSSRPKCSTKYEIPLQTNRSCVKVVLVTWKNKSWNSSALPKDAVFSKYQHVCAPRQALMRTCSHGDSMQHRPQWRCNTHFLTDA